jgi:hypothetical protein
VVLTGLGGTRAACAEPFFALVDAASDELRSVKLGCVSVVVGVGEDADGRGGGGRA